MPITKFVICPICGHKMVEHFIENREKDKLIYCVECHPDIEQGQRKIDKYCFVGVIFENEMDYLYGCKSRWKEKQIENLIKETFDINIWINQFIER